LKLSQTPYYAAARILHPEHRTDWIQDPSLMFRVQKLWETFRRDNIPSLSYDRTLDPKRNEAPCLDSFDKILQNLKQRTSRPQSQDEFENYCHEPPSYDIKMPALQWWLQDTQQKRWPQLSSWAIRILSIPSMSDKPERIFSGSRRTVSWEKTAMTATTLEQLECTRDWKRGNLLNDNF
jgi:hypothetical protein